MMLWNTWKQGLMSEMDPKTSRRAIEIESTDRWVAGKSEEELLIDLKAYLARLRDDPRSLVDRLRVAAIQLRLGRVQEALIHYEGVLRGYVTEGQIISAIALCQRILGIYPNLPRIQRILAALYARAPRGFTGAPAPVTPIGVAEDIPTATFVVADGEEQSREGNEQLVSRVFPEVSPANRPLRGQRLLDSCDDLRPTIPYSSPQTEELEESAPHEKPILLIHPKEGNHPEAKPKEVVLLTNPKKKH